jgi:hypothetical protein
VNGCAMAPAKVPMDDRYTVKRRIMERPIRVTAINTDKTHLRGFLDFDE